jgi:DNA-binding MarR family transcriptional regulator
MTSSNPPFSLPLTASREELLIDGRDDRLRALLGHLVSFAGELQEIRATIARRMGVTPPQYNILMSLVQAGGEQVTVRRLAERLHVSVPFIVTETGRLEEAGLLHKRADQEDRRRVFLELSEEGLNAVSAIAPVQKGVNDVLFGSLSRADFEALERLTRGLLDSCPQALAQALPPTSKARR